MAAKKRVKAKPGDNRIKSLMLEKRKLQLLITFHRRALATQGIDELLSIFSQEIQQLLRAERVTLFLLDSRKEELFARVALGLDHKSVSSLRFPTSQGVAGFVARSGQMLNILNAYKDSRFDPRFDELYGFKTKSILAAPLKSSKGEVFGVLEVFNKLQDGRFNKDDEGILSLISGQLSAALENSQLVEQLKRSNLEAIYILAQAAEYRDQEDTATHLKQMSDYSALLARSMNLEADKVEMIRFASPLHDIGKIAIQDAILKKPGRYTPEEYDDMKRHTILGYEILKDAQSPTLQMAREIALTHHERFDGTGYPRKLKGEEIPVEARIVSLADVFDALCTERVYKPPWPFERVVDHIRSESGKHFHPEVVEAFMFNVLKFEAMYAEKRKHRQNPNP